MGDPDERPASLEAEIDERIDRRVRADIESFGWHVALVPSDGQVPGWAHSIGLHGGFDHPELLCFGANLEFLHGLVNALGRQIREGERFGPDTRHGGLLADYPVAFRRVASCWVPTFLGNAAWHYRSDAIPALQCFWPDRAGHFPWEPDFEPALRGDQPLLYEERAERALSVELRAVLREEGAL